MIVKARVGGGIAVETVVNLLFAIGVAGGSLAPLNSRRAVSG